MLTHGELFAGISGFGQGFARAGIRTAWHVEIDRHCQSILRRHHPDDLLLADVREAGAHNLAPVDIISFGSPCQDLSVAGRRKGLAGARSGLFFEAVRIVGELHPALALWENVPGALTSHAGRDFAAVLDALGELGPLALGWAVLDAQWFGVAQRRRRLFLVASFREWADPAEILALADGLSGHPAPRREAGAGVAAGLTAGSRSDHGVSAPGRRREDDVNLVAATLRVPSHGATWRGDGCDNLVAAYGGNDTRGERAGDGALTAKGGTGRHDFESETFVVAIQEGADTREKGRGGLGVEIGVPMYTFDTAGSHAVAHALTAEGHEASEDGTGRGTPLVVESVALRGRGGGATAELGGDLATALRASQGGGDKPHVMAGMAVRRLTPRECERLQGFPDDYTAWGIGEDGRRVDLSDSARYRMLGNAVNVAVTAWLGGQIARVRHG